MQTTDMRWILYFLILIATPSFADSIFWSQNSAIHGIDERTALYGEYQPRWVESLGDPQSSIFRWALLYRFDPELRIGLGQAWVPQYLPSERNENRIFEQVEWFPKTIDDAWTFIRGRIEQRWIENTGGISHRVRARIQVAWMKGVFGPYVWDEFFINANGHPGIVVRGFDQNRVSVGARFQPDRFFTIELGYLYQTIRSFSNIQNNPGVLLNASLTIW